MAILVVCPGCKTRFQVNEKFAGKEGPCPKCKAKIKIPDASEEIKIHMPEQFASAGKGVKGQAVAKPIARKQARLNPVTAVAVVGGTLATLVIALVAGEVFREMSAVAAVGLLLVSFPLVIGGYAILFNDELEPYTGRSLWIRAAICSVVYAALWGVYAILPADMFSTGFNWLFIAPPFLVVGAIAAYSTLELTVENAFFHYCFYVLASMVLRWAIGLPWVWDVASAAA